MMVSELRVLLPGLNIQQNAEGDLVGFIHPEKLKEALEQLETLDNGCVRFICEKRRKQHPKYSHMGAQVRIPNNSTPNTPTDNTPTSDKSDKITDNW